MTTSPIPPSESPPPRPAGYFQGAIGWLYALALALVVWLLVGLLFRPIWWPWWW